MICRRDYHADTERETHARMWYGPPVKMIDLSVIFFGGGGRVVNG